MKNKAGIFSSILLLAVFTIFLSCKQQKTEWQGTIEEVDGVTVVKNPKEPIFTEDVLKLEEDLILGEQEGKEEYMFTRIMIDVDDEGNIYVLDRQQHRAYIFNNHGNYIKAIGGKGQGPGEFNTPSRIVIDGEDRINVLGVCLNTGSDFLH